MAVADETDRERVQRADPAPAPPQGPGQFVAAGIQHIQLAATLRFAPEERAVQQHILANLTAIHHILRKLLAIAAWMAAALMWIICWMTFQ